MTPVCVRDRPLLNDWQMDALYYAQYAPIPNFATLPTFDGRELHPSKEEKAARIGASLVSNHSFLDGNKRIGMYVMLTFLETNGVRIDCTDEDIVQAGLALADGTMAYDGLLAWIREHAALK